MTSSGSANLSSSEPNHGFRAMDSQVCVSTAGMDGQRLAQSAMRRTSSQYMACEPSPLVLWCPTLVSVHASVEEDSASYGYTHGMYTHGMYTHGGSRAHGLCGSVCGAELLT